MKTWRLGGVDISYLFIIILESEGRLNKYLAAAAFMGRQG